LAVVFDSNEAKRNGKQWRKPKTKIKNLIKLGFNKNEAYMLGNSRRKTLRIRGNFNLNFAMPKKLLSAAK